MKLCLKCFTLWPNQKEGTAFCGKCRRAFGRRCPNGHLNPLFSPAIACLTCNEAPLDGVPYLSLAWAAPLLSLITLILIWRWVWHHPCQTILTLWRVGIRGVGLLFDTAPCSVAETIRQLFAGYVALWLLSFFLPQGLRLLLRQTLKQLPRLLWRGLGLVARLLKVLVIRSAGPKIKEKSARTRNEPHDPT